MRKTIKGKRRSIISQYAKSNGRSSKLENIKEALASPFKKIKLQRRVDRFVTKKPYKTLTLAMVSGLLIGYFMHR